MTDEMKAGEKVKTKDHLENSDQSAPENKEE